jgi:hypothetical protein
MTIKLIEPAAYGRKPLWSATDETTGQSWNFRANDDGGYALLDAANATRPADSPTHDVTPNDQDGTYGAGGISQ